LKGALATWFVKGTLALQVPAEAVAASTRADAAASVSMSFLTVLPPPAIERRSLSAERRRL
jgi:hypothetical protein